MRRVIAELTDDEIFIWCHAYERLNVEAEVHSSDRLDPRFRLMSRDEVEVAKSQ